MNARPFLAQSVDADLCKHIKYSVHQVKALLKKKKHAELVYSLKLCLLKGFLVGY